jgi:mannose-6-phosphate isomerase-like protein (cupin superfamily)
MFKHEDDRRLLVEMQAGEFKACKVVVAKRDCVLGNHYHAHKDERFLLVKGGATRVVIGDNQWLCIEAPYEWDVPRGVPHSFELIAGSVMVGTATKEYEAGDEIAS